MTTNIQLLRSSIANKRPAPATLLEGQAAINLNTTEPGLYFKLSSGVLTKVGPTCVNSSGVAPNASPAGSSGNAIGEQWFDSRSTLSSPVLKVYDGSAWRPSSGFLVDDANGNFSLSNQITVRNLIANGTGANAYIRLNVGPTTDQSSITAASGMIRYDSTTNEFVGYYGGGSAGWRIIGPTVSTPGDGQINVNVGTGLSVSGTNATANQTGNTTRTISLDTTYADGRYVLKTGSTMTGLLTLSSDPVSAYGAATKQYVDNNSGGTPGNGQINVEAGTGLTVSGNNASANQTGNTTRTLTLDLTYVDGRFVKLSGGTMTGALSGTSAAYSGKVTSASTVDGDSATTLTTKDYLLASVGVSSPVGAVIMYAASNAPSGWLECDGSAIPAQYTALIALVGANVPDLRGEFVRGWDNGRGIDSGRALLSAQGEGVQQHTHPISGLAQNVSNATGQHSGYGTTNIIVFSGTNTADAQSGTGTETRPRNVALMYIIKAS